LSIELLEQGVSGLGELVDEVVFVGGATLALWITDPAAPPPRPTKDVDVIVEVETRREYHQLEKRIRAAGFRDDGTVICRWIHRKMNLTVDVMPTDASLLGFQNHWQSESFSHAVERELPSGARIKAIPPPFLLATKVEAFLGRGQGDLTASKDFADIVSLVDGREELLDEVRLTSEPPRRYLAVELAKLLDESRLLDGVRAQLPPGQASQNRAQSIVIPRLHELVSTVAGS